MGGICGTFGGRKKRVWVSAGNPVETNNLVIDGRTILKWILNKYVGSAWTGLSSSGKGQVAVFFKQGNKHLGSVKCGVILD